METPSPDDLTGRVLGGRYRIERPLKRGGMGQVYAARDETESKPVAVKVVRQALLEDPQALARFKREARLMTELKHENIVTSLNVGEDGGLLWIAMELLEGESLRERLDARGRMAWQETLPIIEQVVRALQVAHDKGVIHRDLKPENVMINGEKAKLLDFGVAKQAHVEGQSGTSNMTGTGLIVGTPGYVAPEVVLEGRTDDPRSDFYALGVTWFEMLTAQKPFTAKTAFALAMRHAHEPAPTPTSLVPYSPVPGPIERLVLRLMAKSPDERPQNAVSLLDALKNLAEESQRALTNPTPHPESLDQATMTATDLSKPSTGVVPFKTPMPSAPTPATAQLPPGMTPQPDVAQLGAQMFAALPKKKLALGAAALLVLMLTAVAVVVVVVVRYATPPAPIAAQVIAPAPPPPQPAPPPVVVAQAPPPAPVETPVTTRAEHREEKRKEREARKDPVAVVAEAGLGSVRVQGLPKDEGWKVGVDDDSHLRDSPWTFDNLTPGAHRFVFLSAKTGNKSVKVVDIKAGQNGLIRGPNP